jgi:hypothetical protein
MSDLPECGDPLATDKRQLAFTFAAPSGGAGKIELGLRVDCDTAIGRDRPVISMPMM